MEEGLVIIRRQEGKNLLLTLCQKLGEILGKFLRIFKK